ncbi:uncharacterized protein LOC128222166 isoform X2 [Mya arenaria]|nr:uncharacterized protein LOC128222166 isoform X2 [Mya arenaria]
MGESIEARHENWLRVVWGLLYVREGLQGYVDTKGKDQYQVFRNNVMGKCNNQTCNQCQVNKSGKFRPGHFCYELNKEIQNNHVKKRPKWANTDSTKWQDQHVGHWEVSKCYLSSSGYFDKTGPNDVDASGLLSICINSSFINQHISNTQHFEEVRNIRNKTLHDAHYELDGQTADDCLDKMVTVLEDPQELVYDMCAKQADNHITKIKAKTEKTPAIMNEALHKWLKTNFDVDQALKEIESQMDERLRKELKQFIVGEVEREVRKSLDDRSDDTRENKLKILQEKLIADILTNYSTIPLNPILQHQDSLLIDFYEPPKMTKTVQGKDEHGKPRTLQKHITKIEELFISNERKVGKSPSHLNRVYISGEAGMGKTSLSQYLALAWCAVHGESEECVRMRETMKKFIMFNDVEYLEQTQLLFLIHLREFENEPNCKKMLSTYLHSQLEYSERDAQELIAVINNPNAVVLIDGLDELQCLTKQMPDFIGLNQTKIVCTSRPWKIDSCVTARTLTYNKITITGIGFDIVERLVRNVTECLRREGYSVRENITDFIKTLNSKELRAIISLRTSDSYELLMIPVVILQLLCLWHDYKDLGSTRTQVYANMAETLLCRMKKKQNAGYSPDTYNIEVSSPLSHLFEKLHAYYCMTEIDNIAKLSKLAFALLFTGPIEHSLLFRERDLDRNNQRMFKEIKQFCLDSGIVRGTSRKSSSYQDEIYSFIHKTYQEFFAALHIVEHNCDESIHGAISANTKSRKDIFELANVFDFVCASDISCAEAMISLIDALTRHTMRTDDEMKIKHIREIQDSVLRACDKYVIGNISINVSNFVLGPLSYPLKYSSDDRNIPLTILQNHPFRIELPAIFPRMVITFNKTLNVLYLERCSVAGPLDLSHCEMEELVLRNVNAACVILGKIGRLRRFTFLNNSMHTTSTIPFLDAEKLAHLSMENLILHGKMDLSQCPLVRLRLSRVKTETLIVGCAKECTIDCTFCSYDFLCATKLNHLTMKNGSAFGTLDLTQCPLERLELTNVETERVIVGCVMTINQLCFWFKSLTTVCIQLHKANKLTYLSMQNCLLSRPLDLSQCPMSSCSYDVTNAKHLNDPTMNNCSLSGPLDLSICPLERLVLTNVKTERVIVGCVKNCKVAGLDCSFDLTNANTLIDLSIIGCVQTQSLNLCNCPIQNLELLDVDFTIVCSLETLKKLSISDCRLLSPTCFSASNCSHVVLKQCLVQNCIQCLPLTTLEIDTCQIMSFIDLSSTSLNQLILHETHITASVFEEQMEHLYSLPRQITCTLNGFWGFWEGCNVGRNLQKAIEKLGTDRRFIVKVNHSPFEYVNTFSVVTNKSIPLI